MYRRFILGSAIASMLLVAVPALAHDTASADGTIQITSPWTRATPAGADVAGGYLTITNKGTAPDRLLGGTFDDAKTTQIHEMSMANGVMKMREIADGLEIKPGESVTFKPGGYHIMFVGLKAPVKEGDGIWGTLNFQHAGAVRVHYRAAALGASSPPGSATAGAGTMEHMDNMPGMTQHK